MTQLLNAFNPMDHDPSQGSGGWPLGKHPVVIESAEVKATKDNSGGMLIFNLKVIDGPNVGHTGPYRLNLYNQSEEAARIAHRQLSAICHVTQTFQLGPDGTQLQYLFGKPFVIEVGMQKGEEAAQKGYTEIKRVFDMAGNEPGKQGQAQQAQQPAQGFGQAQQPAQQAPQAQQGAQAWGQGQQPAQQPAQAAQQPQGGGGQSWGQNGGQQSAQAQQGGNWAQQPAQGQPSGQPAWGQR